MQNEYIIRMVKNMPVLRAAVGLTQAQLGEKVGVSRQTIVAIENGKRPLPWSLFLAMICVFERYVDGKDLLDKLNLFPNDYLIGDQ